MFNDPDVTEVDGNADFEPMPVSNEDNKGLSKSSADNFNKVLDGAKVLVPLVGDISKVTSSFAELGKAKIEADARKAEWDSRKNISKDETARLKKKIVADKKAQGEELTFKRELLIETKNAYEKALEFDKEKFNDSQKRMDDEQKNRNDVLKLQLEQGKTTFDKMNALIDKKINEGDDDKAMQFLMMSSATAAANHANLNQATQPQLGYHPGGSLSGQPQFNYGGGGYPQLGMGGFNPNLAAQNAFQYQQPTNNYGMQQQQQQQRMIPGPGGNP